MLKYLSRRIAIYVVLIFVTTSIAYILASSIFQPGQAMEQQTPRPTQEQINRSLQALGLDPHLNAWQRYLQWLSNIVFHWDWGRGPDNTIVNHEFGIRVWVSVRLYVLGTLLSLFIGILLGVISAVRQYKASDRILTGYSYLTFVIPVPVVYVLMQALFIKINESSGSQFFFVTGSSGEGVEGFWNIFMDQFRHYFVPTLAMTVMSWASYQVTMRQFLLDYVNADFVRTARATGLTRSKAIWRHAFRVSFIPVAQQIAFVIPAIFVGGFFAESVFNWQGIGLWSLESIGKQDVNSTVAVVAFGSCVTAASFMLADFLTVLVDPRVRM